MSVDLFGCLPVRDFTAALAWYERFFGMPPTFAPNDTEAVWELGEHCYLYIEFMPERAGGGKHTIFVSDLDDRIAGMEARGIQSASQETYENGVRKVIYLDPDGNEIGIGGEPGK